MKTLISYFILIVSLQGAPVIDPSRLQRHLDFVLPPIQDTRHHTEAEQALQAYHKAETPVQVMAAVASLSRIPEASAKAAALYLALDPSTQEDLQKTIRFRLEELPVLFSWLVSNGLTAGEMFGSGDSMAIVQSLVKTLSGEVNEVLGTAGSPADAGPSAAPAPVAYGREKLLAWSAGQVQTAMETGKWTESELEYLVRLNAALKKVNVPSAAAAKDLIPIVLEPATANAVRGQKPMAATPAVTDPKAHVSAVPSYNPWLWASLAALIAGFLWFLISRKSRHGP